MTAPTYVGPALPTMPLPVVTQTSMRDLLQSGVMPPERIVQPDLTAEMSWAERATAFHEANPGVATYLRSIALRLRRRGLERYSMSGLFAVLRFEAAMRTEDPTSDFKINQNYSTWYAKHLMETTPALAGFFELRQRRG